MLFNQLTEVVNCYRGFVRFKVSNHYCMTFQAVDDLEHVDTKTMNLIRLSFKYRMALYSSPKVRYRRHGLQIMFDKFKITNYL